jgi:hypothetical protein
MPVLWIKFINSWYCICKIEEYFSVTKKIRERERERERERAHVYV